MSMSMSISISMLHIPIVSVCTLPYLILGTAIAKVQKNRIECLGTVRVRVRVRLGKGREGIRDTLIPTDLISDT